jgi:(+)-pinoresinol hydroxylase
MMAIPPGVSERDFSAALGEFERAVGSDWVFTSDADIALYRDAYSPVQGEPEEILVSAAVAPETTEQVQAVVRTANRYGIPIYPISTGRNLGYGGSAPNLSGSVVLDLKRMNRIIEVDDKRHFAIVEPGVSYFDLYRYIQQHGLRVWIDTPDPGWGSPIGNALDHGVGYTYGGYRDHFNSHCGMEVVLPNGDLMRTGMGALPGANTWAEYRYGFGPHVDGLFSQGNFGVVTKMGFWLLPEPEAYLSGTVTVPRRNDIVDLVAIVNRLEHLGLAGMPNYGSPLRQHLGNADVAEILARPFARAARDLERWSLANETGYYTCELQFYGPKETVQANWRYAQRLLSEIPGARFALDHELEFPLTADQAEGLHKVALGIPNLEIFNIGRRQSATAPGWDGEIWFSPVIPKSGEAVLEAQEVFTETFREIGMPSFTNPASTPATWMYRTFIFIMGLPVARGRIADNQRMREAFTRLANVGAEHGWAEYRTPPIFQDLIMSHYSFNDHVLRRFSETLKDAVDPNGIISAGRGGIWPRHLRDGNG